MHMSNLQMVAQFHERFQVPSPSRPSLHSMLERGKLRLSLIEEEAMELRDAMNDGDLVKVLDATTDLLYVAYGAQLEFGMGHISDLAFAAVHLSNLSKLDPQGRPILRTDGKILKGPNFREPQLKHLLTL